MRVVNVEGLSGGFLWWVGKQGGIVSTVEVGWFGVSVVCCEEKRRVVPFFDFATTH